MTLITNSKLPSKLPPELLKGLASAKSHVIGRACRIKVCATNSFLACGLHVAREDQKSARAVDSEC